MTMLERDLPWAVINGVRRKLDHERTMQLSSPSLPSEASRLETG